MKKNLLTKKAFTLVELIIVIAIIAILAVSAGLMLTKWTWKSKDARVISDLKTIERAMQIQYTYNGKYPMPDNEKEVKWVSWELLWYQWTLWKKAISSIDKLTKVPEDPTKANPKEWYDYSVTKDQQTYQVFGFISDKKYAIGNSYLNETNADKKQYYITSVGNYNGYVIGATGNKYVIYATPSLYILTWDYWIYSLNSPYKNYFYKIWKKVSDLMKKWEKIPYVDITELVQNPENTIELNTIANSFKIQKISKLVSAINNAGNNKWWKIVKIKPSWWGKIKPSWWSKIKPSWWGKIKPSWWGKIKPSWWGIIIQNTGTVCDAETWSLHNYWLSVEKNATYSWKNYDKIIYLSGDENLACMYKALHDKENFWKGIAFVLESDIDFTYLSWHYADLNKNLNFTEEENLSDDEFLIYEALQYQSTLPIKKISEILNKKNVLPVINSMLLKRAISLKEEIKQQYKPKLVKYIKLAKAFKSDDSLNSLMILLKNIKTWKLEKTLLRQIRTIKLKQ